MTSAVKFALPSGAQYFTPFAAFPVEIRHQIWEAAIFEPGMSFLKIVPNHDQGHVLAQVIQGSRRFLLIKAHLAPIFQNPKADNSNYVALAKVLDTLSNTCTEADRVVQRLLRDPGTLKVNGRPIALTSHAQDIVCLDYLPSGLFYNDHISLQRDTHGPKTVGEGLKFRSNGRTYFEIARDQNDWLVQSRVFETLDWVRTSFRRYAVESTTTRNRHKRPREVQFKVLSCEWDVAQATAAPKAKSVTPKKGDNKRAFAGEATERARKTARSTGAQHLASAPALSSQRARFVFGQGEHYDFVFGGDGGRGR
ncbi:hypothetical protein ACHAQH_009458 [Verticillium albo-atrum]